MLGTRQGRQTEAALAGFRMRFPFGREVNAVCDGVSGTRKASCRPMTGSPKHPPAVLMLFAFVYCKGFRAAHTRGRDICDNERLAIQASVSVSPKSLYVCLFRELYRGDCSGGKLTVAVKIQGEGRLVLWQLKGI